MAGSTSMRRSPSASTSPTSNGANCSTGWAASGRRVKSGQMTPLKTCRRSAAMVAGRACTRIGGRLAASPAADTLSASKPMASTWSRCEWLTRMWSMRAISSSVRSPTPVPASMSMLSSSRNDVVRLPAAIEPEQPRTRICMGQRDGAPQRTRAYAEAAKATRKPSGHIRSTAGAGPGPTVTPVTRRAAPRSCGLRRRLTGR